MIETAVIVRCDGDCDANSDWWAGSVPSLERRLLDAGWIKNKKSHYCPVHADGHR